MTPSTIKRWTFNLCVYLLGLPLLWYTIHIYKDSPRQPDPASGHVYRTRVWYNPGQHRSGGVHDIVYLTATEQSRLKWCDRALFVELFAVLGIAFITKQRAYNKYMAEQRASKSKADAPGPSSSALS